jgi:hypothetical protein
MVVSYIGRKSGKTYHTPVDYSRSGDTLLTISYKRRTWWRNMRGGVPVTIRLKGKDVHGQAEVVEDDQGVMEGFKDFYGGDPRTARLFGVKPGVDGQLDPESLRQAASELVIVHTTLI